MRPLEAPARLAAQQTEFAAHLRNPDAKPAPAGLEDRRMAIYRELFYNSLEGILANNFPVIRGLRDDAWWHERVRGFYRDWHSHTPLFTEIGREFMRYLEQRAEQGADDPPFLVELAHYEWIEMVLALDETELSDIDCVADGDLLVARPVLSPLAWPLAYQFPVHRIRADFQPEQAPEQPTFLLIVRERDNKIRFKAIEAIGFHLLQALAHNPGQRSGREVLLDLAAQVGVIDGEAFVVAGAQMLEQLRQRQAILGTAVGPSR
ncbi:MAG: HvfC family RiPP maturation protein [Pseudomarimonas sp.]